MVDSECVLTPIREHFRYTFLLIAAALFTAGVVIMLRQQWNIFPGWNKWVTVLLILSIAEIFWEFIHQYQTHSHLKSWISQGNKHEDFEAHYFTPAVLYTGCIGRIFQYLLIAWLAFILMRGRYMRKWAFAVIGFFCALGLTSAIGIIITAMHLPKNMEILMIFFIPAAPLLLLYWEAVAVLTRKSVPYTIKK